jgi:hypothetical protein
MTSTALKTLRGSRSPLKSAASQVSHTKTKGRLALADVTHALASKFAAACNVVETTEPGLPADKI